MTPDPHAVATPAPPTAAPRVQLAPSSVGTQDLDGGWWPRSTDLTAELPVLLAAVSDHVGHVAVIGYPLSAWTPAPEHLDTAGGEVRLQGFVSDDPQTLVVIGERGHALSLLVIPPDTPAASAHRLMRDVCRSLAAAPAVESVAERNTDKSLDDVAVRLARHAGQSDPGHAALIAGWVEEAAAQFTAMPVQAFIPILVEHIVRARIVSAGRAG